jgi:hypothetical protein
MIKRYIMYRNCDWEMVGSLEPLNIRTDLRIRLDDQIGRILVVKKILCIEIQ